MNSKFALLVLLLTSTAIQGQAGSIFLTGHDPDFHAVDSVGARHINQVAINYVTDAAFNSFTQSGIDKFLFVQSNISVPAGHRNGVIGLQNSGFVLGTDFEQHNASDLAAEISLLGTKYNAIVIASDFGGILTQAELNVLNASSTTIINFLNNGGGLFAMSEGNNGAYLTPGGGFFGFLPFVTTSHNENQSEAGTTVTAFGSSLGLTNLDVSSNYSHNVFDGTFGLSVVDRDGTGDIVSLAGRAQISVPDTSSTFLLLTVGVVILARFRRTTK